MSLGTAGFATRETIRQYLAGLRSPHDNDKTISVTKTFIKNYDGKTEL